WWIETPLLGQWPRSELPHEVVKVLGLQLSGRTQQQEDRQVARKKARGVLYGVPRSYRAAERGEGSSLGLPIRKARKTA
ncbi:uncharacterized protein P884DRAFT_318291, partial [Thermothelomyces heterothallicus CBS 202.75]|uniref:uncharacterized protein n=1 Tax=Thermothelomyces heterothallicus CBS 202.75 TaxID=1149848 RepID=UPI003741FDC9